MSSWNYSDNVDQAKGLVTSPTGDSIRQQARGFANIHRNLGNIFVPGV